MKLQRDTDKRDILKQVPLFRSLSKKSLDEIAQKSDEVEMSAGTVLAKQGEIGSEFVFILEGEARIEKDGNVINHLSTDDFFGEIALIDGKPRTASVIAETDMRLLVMHARFFQPLLNTIPGLAYEVAVALCKYLRKAQSTGS